MSDKGEARKDELVAVRVTAKRDGWWRAGLQWSAAGTEASVTQEQLAMLEAEPMLIVERLAPAPADGGKKG